MGRRPINLEAGDVVDVIYKNVEVGEISGDGFYKRDMSRFFKFDYCDVVMVRKVVKYPEVKYGDVWLTSNNKAWLVDVNDTFIRGILKLEKSVFFSENPNATRIHRQGR